MTKQHTKFEWKGIYTALLIANAIYILIFYIITTSFS